MAKDSQEAANVLQTISVIKKDTASKIKMQVQMQDQAQKQSQAQNQKQKTNPAFANGLQKDGGSHKVDAKDVKQGGQMFGNIFNKKNALDSLVTDLRLDSVQFAVQLEALKKENDGLLQQMNHYKSLSELFAKQKDTLSQQLQKAKEHQSPIVALTSPSGCAVLIVLIIALTVIAVKKGVSISKGNTSISVGDNKK